MKHLKLYEEFNLPIEIGDEVLMGKFKNKKTIIKTIDWNDKGDLLINGKPALKFRITKKFDNSKCSLNDISST